MGTKMGVKTDHSADIKMLRTMAKATAMGLPRKDKLVLLVASDLLELHDRQSFSLDKWKAARDLVESLIMHSITENHV